MISRFEDLAGLLGGLKGAPASVLWALVLAGRPLSQQELGRLTGYSEKPVRQAVKSLLARGIIERDGPRVLALAEGWMAVTGGERWSNLPGNGAEWTTRPTLPALPSSEAAGAEGPGEDNPAGETGEMPETEQRAAGKDGDDPAESTRSAAERAAGDQQIAESGRWSRGGGTTGGPDLVVDGIDLDRDEGDQQQQAAGKARLATLLRRMGIHGPAFKRLAARADLAARPEAVLAWWWYYRTQPQVRNPAGLAIGCLDSREEPPEGFLALARVWPQMTAGMRQEMESLYLHNWSAAQIAAVMRPAYPGLTAGAVVAYMALYVEAPEALDNGEL